MRFYIGLAARMAFAFWIVFLWFVPPPTPSICENLTTVASDMADLIQRESASIDHLRACDANEQCHQALDTVRNFGSSSKT